MWMILLIAVVVILGIKVAIRGAKAEYKEKRAANALSVKAKNKSAVQSPAPVLKLVEQPEEYPRLDVEWEDTFREIDRAVSRGDYDFARTWLQKFSYTTVDKDVPQAVRYRFKTLMTAFAKQDPLYLRLIAKIRPLIEARPGIMQTALYPQLPGYDEEQIRYVLYFAHELGDVNRLKKGRSYQLLLPGQALLESETKDSKPKWKAVNHQYQCTKCEFFTGLSKALKAEDKTCPKCSAPLRKIRCKHEVVKFYANHHFCQKCHAIVVAVE